MYREYLERCADDLKLDLYIIGTTGYKMKWMLYDVFDLQNGQYVTDHVCYAGYDNTIPNGSIVVGKAHIYRYGINEWGLRFNKKHTHTVTPVYWNGKIVYLDNSVNNYKPKLIKSRHQSHIPYLNYINNRQEHIHPLNEFVEDYVSYYDDKEIYEFYRKDNYNCLFVAYKDLKTILKELNIL